MADQETKPTEAENQVENELENVDFGDDVQNQEIENETPQETDGQETQQEVKEEKPINQEAVQKRIDEITFAKYEEKRKREKAEADLAELQAKLMKQEAAKENIDIPDLPDIYDEDYEDRIKAREVAIEKAAEIRARKKFEDEAKQKLNAAQFEKQHSDVMKQVDKMYSSVSDYGMTKEELQKADETVSKFIKEPDLARFLIAQDDAALLIKYLSSSATELEKISGMSPLNASVYIATKVSSEAKKLKPGLTKTPEPPEIPKGKATPKKDPFLEGVKFE